MTTSPVETRRTSPSMHALVLDGRLRLGQLPRPALGPGRALVRVDACAISRIDLDLVEGRRPVQVRPAVLGHQFVGTVEAVGERVDPVWRERRVVARPSAGCRRCSACRDGRPWLCEDARKNGIGMGLVDGAFADYVVLPVESLVEVPDQLDDEDAVLAYPVAVALEAIQRIHGDPPQRVLVVGDGNMGLLVTLMLHAFGHTVSTIGRHPSRREILWRSGIGFRAVDEGVAQNPETWAEIIGEPYGVVIECSGRSSGLEFAARALRPRGQLVMVSDHVGQPGSGIGFLLERELELVGVGAGPLGPAVEYLASGALDVLPLIDNKFSLDDGVTAFHRAGQRGSLRTILLRSPRVEGA